MITEKRGGKRANAGRKPLKDKRILIYAYPKASEVKGAGGKRKAQSIALAAIVAAAQTVRP